MPLSEITLVEGRPAEGRAFLMKQIADVVETTLGANMVLVYRSHFPSGSNAGDGPGT